MTPPDYLALAAELEKLSAAASPPISYRSTVVLEAAAAIRRLHTDLQLAYAQRDQEARTHVAAEAGLVEEAREARRERDEALISAAAWKVRAEDAEARAARREQALLKIIEWATDAESGLDSLPCSGPCNRYGICSKCTASSSVSAVIGSARIALSPTQADEPQKCEHRNQHGEIWRVGFDSGGKQHRFKWRKCRDCGADLNDEPKCEHESVSYSPWNGPLRCDDCGAVVPDDEPKETKT